MPKRGAKPMSGHSNAVFVMPCPATKMPFVELPVLGTIAPMAMVEPGPRNWPLTGFIAWRFVPEQG